MVNNMYNTGYFRLKDLMPDAGGFNSAEMGNLAAASVPVAVVTDDITQNDVQAMIAGQEQMKNGVTIPEQKTSTTKSLIFLIVVIVLVAWFGGAK